MPWIAPNIYRQDTGPSALPWHGDGPSDLYFRHIIHAAVTASDTITEARLVPGCPEIRCVAVDAEVTRYFDIIAQGIAAPIDSIVGEEFVILTSSDTHVKSSFYAGMAMYIRAGFDAFTVSRQQVNAPQFPNLILSTAATLGLDAVVFPSRLFPSFIQSDARIGDESAPLSLLLNLAVFAKRWLILTKTDLTASFGATPVARPGVDAHNEAEADRVQEQLSASPWQKHSLREFRDSLAWR